MERYNAGLPPQHSTPQTRRAMPAQDGKRGMMEREVIVYVENVICLVGPVGMRGPTRCGIEPPAFVVGEYNAHTRRAAYRTRFTSE